MLALALALPATTKAAPSRSATPGSERFDSESEAVSAALKKWASGDWISVRSILEPLISSGPLNDPLLTETALRYLADATLLDENLDPQIRTQLAMSYINRLFDGDPSWQPPPGTHGKPLYDLYDQLREQHERAKLDSCMAERASCAADLDDLKARHETLRGQHEALKIAFGQQEVEVREKVARNRAIALIPFGVGHFYNGRKGLGAGFLAGEAIIGGTGLGLLLFRRTQCTRTNGFLKGSVDCKVKADDRETLLAQRDAVLNRRNAEQTLGIMFIGLIAVDILIAQLTFEPYATIKTERIKREDLEAEPAPPKPRTKGPRKGRKTRSRDRDNLQVRPHPAFFPGGGGAGITLHF